MKRKVLERYYNSEMCLVCGLENELGLKAAFYRLEGDEILGVFHPREEHQSYPDRVHGGISAAFLDEILGRVINLKDPNGFGVTMTLSTTYRKPVPLTGEIRAIGRLVKETSRTYEATGEILLEDGQVAVQAKGTYYKMPLEKIAGEEEVAKPWRRDLPNNLEEIEL